jgi:hypothetical protein
MSAWFPHVFFQGDYLDINLRIWAISENDLTLKYNFVISEEKN